MDRSLPSPGYCCCSALADFAVVSMGGIGLDRLIFSSLKEEAKHGGDQWWLYVSICSECRQTWMIAQDERIYDNYYLRRITPGALREIVDLVWWPEEFLTYERVLAMGKATGRFWRFMDTQSPALVATAEDLRRERPGITVAEIASLLAISIEQAEGLLSN